MPNYKSKYKGSQIDGLLDFVNDNKNNIAMQSDIPTVPSKTSDLNNDSNFIDNTVNNLVNYYLKTETYTQSEINTLVSAAASGGFVKVNELPTENINIKAIYLVPYTGSRAKNLYEEYIYVDSDWEMIGTTKIDLSNYITTEALNTALADYVATTDLNTILNSYVTSSSLSTTLGDYITNTNFNNSMSNKQDKMQFETMPAASTDYLEKIIQYIGLTTNDYHNGRFYKCVTDGTNYSWEEQSGGVSNFNELSNRPTKEVTSIQSLIDPVPLPSHAQMGSVGFTPLGTIIAYYGETAPRHFLACDGAEYNKTDYPELWTHLSSLTDTTPYIVDGDNTKFKVPDLRGEFLRGTGTNGHTNSFLNTTEGSGSNVGVHQQSTVIPNTYGSDAGTTILVRKKNGSLGISVNNADAILKSTVYAKASSTNDTGASNATAAFSLRPTNTSVLYCIAYKDIYVDAKFDYSTQEKVVGTWIDGKPLYRIAKYYQGTYAVTPKGTVDFGVLGASNVDLVIDLMCTVTNAADTQRYFYGHGNFIYDKTNDHVSFYSDGDWSNLRPIVTMLYTKTTD